MVVTCGWMMVAMQPSCGSCFRCPGKHYTGYINYGDTMPDAAEYNSICQNCWETEAKDDEEACTSSSSEEDRATKEVERKIDPLPFPR